MDIVFFGIDVRKYGIMAKKRDNLYRAPRNGIIFTGRQETG